MSLLRIIYLILAVVGAIKPMMHFFAWFNEHGYAWADLVAAWTVNEASKGLMWDLTISAVVLTLWMMAEVYVRKDWWVLPICLLATFGIGVSCGLPLYLFLRSRAFK